MSAARGLIRPPGLIRLDKSHPLTPKVIGAFTFGLGPPRDLLGKWGVGEFNSTPTVAVGQVGPYGSFTAGGYAAGPGTSSAFTGNLSVVTVVMRAVSASTTAFDPNCVRGVYSTAVTGGTTGFELNLGNGFGAAGDIDKPRAVDNNTTGAAGAWLNGVKQSSAGLFDTALTNGVWYGIGTTHASISAGSADIYMGMVADSATDYFLNGGIACIWVFSGILPDAQMADLSVNPWQIVKTQADDIRFWGAYSAASGDGVGSAAGTSTVTAVGASVAAGAGSATGTSTVSGVGAGTGAAVGSGTGTGTATGVGAATAAAVGFSDGTSTATGIAPTTSDAVGTAAGTSTAEATAENDVIGRRGRWLRGRYTVVGDPEPDGPIVPDVRDITAEVVRSEARAVAAEMRAARARKDAAEVAALRQDLREMRALLRRIEDEEDEAAALLLALL